MSSEVSRKPVIIFDTSGINNLADEKDFKALAAGLRTAYHTRLTGSNIEEIAATTKPEDRGKLLDRCQLLLSSGDCIDPFNWLVEKQVRAFDQPPEGVYLKNDQRTQRGDRERNRRAHIL